MFHIILFILRIFGIILLSIIGIFLSLILIVLFVPIRYQLDAEKNENVKANAKISWLLHLLLCQITFHNSNFRIRIRILGITFYDSDKPKEKVKKNVKKTSRKLGKKAKRKVIEEVEDLEVVEELKKVDELEKVDEVKEVKKIDEIKETKEIEEKKFEPVEEISKDNASLQDESKGAKVAKYIKTGRRHKKKHRNKFKVVYQKMIAKIKQILDMIKNLFIKIKDTLSNMKDKIVEIKAAWLTIKNFLKNETNKAAIKKVFISLKKILRHIRPSKVRINMEFGIGDPCQTGQALGGIALLYGFYGEAIHVIPNFETEIYEGTLFLKGRIRLFSLLIISIKLLINKNFRQFIKNLRAVKEEL